MARRYGIYDVFTDQVLAGNPLAVIFDADGLDDNTMQAVAREMNLSETVFVKASSNSSYVASLRIFTPTRELPFAGHPTVGTAVALAELQHGDDSNVDIVCVLEERVGPVRCAVRLRQRSAGFAEFDLPKTPVLINLPLDASGIADALSLNAKAVGFENHKVSIWSAGVPFVLIPVHSRREVEALEFDTALWEKVAPFVEGSLTSAYVYCRGGVNHQARFHARMFSPDMGIAEDPATGSAVAAFAGAVHHFDALPDGHHPLLVEQGVEMGRPSYIHLHIDVKDEKIAKARIGGQAVRLARGTLEL